MGVSREQRAGINDEFRFRVSGVISRYRKYKLQVAETRNLTPETKFPGTGLSP
jgi:hypothetical protein